ncbi:MAG: cell wall-binding repeat-containing protein [Actinobacteria bacterium]|nr:cell wall-binding repeat-containing protein [Actinomycetota bacterium]
MSHVQSRAAWTLVLAVALLLAFLPTTSAALPVLGAPPQPHIEPPPRHTAVRPGADHGRIEISGTADPNATIETAYIVIVDENGVLARRDATDRVLNVGGVLSGNYTLGPLDEDQQSATSLYLEVTTRAGSAAPETGRSNSIPIDITKPFITTWRLVSTDRIEITFSEPVEGPNQPSDWAIGPSGERVCPFESSRPAAVTGTDARRTLTLAVPVGEDATPHVCYNSDVEAYHDGAFNLVSGDSDFADDAIPPRAPRFTHIDGKPLDSNGRVRSNEPTPDVTLDTVTQGHTVHIYLNDGSPGYEPEHDPEVGEAVVTGSGGQVLVENVGGKLPDRRLPEGHNRFFARAEDPSGNLTELADIRTAVYELDSIAPTALAAAATAERVFVSFSEPLFGPNDVSRWCVSTGAPITDVRGSDGSALREVVVAGLTEGDTISYDRCGGSPDPSTRYTDAVGNRLVPFTIPVTGGPVVLIDDVSVSEGDQGDFPVAEFRLSISEPPADHASVTYATFPGSAEADEDYYSLAGSVEFPQGETEDRTVSVPIKGDVLDEFDETFGVVIESKDEHANVLPGADRGTGTILDDDPLAAVSVGDVDVAEGGSAPIEVRLDRPSGKDVTVGWRSRSASATDGLDFTAATGAVTIPAGATSAEVLVEALEDTMHEDDEAFHLVLGNPVNATIGDATGRVTILDDDAPPLLRLSDADAVERDTTLTQARPVATLSAISGRDVAFDWLDVQETATRGTDYRAAPRRVVIPAGSTSAAVSIDVLPDTLVEQDETLRVELSSVSGAEVVDGVATVTILDNDGPTDSDRNGGRDRTETSVEVSRDTFPGTTDNVVIARADAYPDALAGGPLAVELLAPILLTPGDALHQAVRQEIQRLDARTAYLLGGDEAVSPAIAAELQRMGLDVVRIGGENRFETAALIAAELGGADAFVTEGINVDPNRGWPDAVAVSALAAHLRVPILLTRAGDLPVETATAIDALGVGEVTVVGGPVAVSEAVEAQLRQLGTSTERLAGDTRYGTSRAVADRSVEVGMEPRAVWFATGRNWPDSLAAGPAVVQQRHGVLVLIDGLNGFGTAPEIGEFLDVHAENILRIVLVGGEAAISDEVAESILLRIDR